jgi:hypothetical protein
VKCLATFLVPKGANHAGSLVILLMMKVEIVEETGHEVEIIQLFGPFLPRIIDLLLRIFLFFTCFSLLRIAFLFAISALIEQE